VDIDGLAASAATCTGAPERELTINAATTPPPSEAASNVNIAVERRNCTFSLAITPDPFLSRT
jgi:hypothetical protein